jgi:hypothetical protein
VQRGEYRLQLASHVDRHLLARHIVGRIDAGALQGSREPETA